MTNVTLPSSTIKNGKSNPSAATLASLFGLLLSALLLSACSSSDTVAPATGPVEPTLTYTVTFNAGGGSEVAPQTIVAGTNAVRPPNPKRKDFDFLNWYKDPAKSQVFNFATEKITNNLTLYARWIATYTVTFDTDKGSAVTAQTVRQGSNVAQPLTDPIWVGHKFTGWTKYSASSGLTTPFNFATEKITSHLTLYARWELKSYSVTFTENELGKVFATYQVKHGAKTPTPDNIPIRTGSVFDGWFKDEALTAAFDFNALTTEPATVYAKWIPAYTITFNTRGGDAVAPLTVGSNRKAQSPVPPKKTGDFFAGWFTTTAGAASKNQAFAFNFDTALVKSNFTLYAGWGDKGATVIFTNARGPVVEVERITFGQKASRPADPISNGYALLGWYKDSAFTALFDFNAPINASNTFVFARFIKTYAVTFITNVGNPNFAVRTVRQGSNAAAPSPAPEWTGRSFAGWFKDAAGTQAFNFATERITANLSLYAKWTLKTYTVSFNTHGGEVLGNQFIKHSSNAARPNPDPKRAGYTFKGWFTTATTNIVFNFANPITKDTTVHASWEVSPYRVEFRIELGNPDEPLALQQVRHGERATKIKDPVIPGNAFLGWYLIPRAKITANTPTYDFNTPVTGALILYGNWMPVFTVTFITNTNASSPPLAVQTVRQGSNATALTPTKEWYAFGGWYTSSALTNAFDFTTAITANRTLYAKWTELQKLLANPVEVKAKFGSKVALSGNTLVVGAYLEDTGGIVNSGAAYVFTRSSATSPFTPQYKLIPSGGVAGDEFGSSVAVSGNTIAVGSTRYEGNDGKSDTGAVYVFINNGSTEWGEQAKLTSSGSATSGFFGNSVALSGNTLVVGAEGENNAGAVKSGAAYVFTRSGSIWSQQARLTPSRGAKEDRFGNSVALSGNTIAVGAPFEDNLGTQNNGAAHIFTNSGSSWYPQGQQLLVSDRKEGDQLGSSIALEGDTLVVGARVKTVPSATDPLVSYFFGAAYVFTRSGNSWSEQTKFSPDPLPRDAMFGTSVALSGDTIVVGAMQEAGSTGAAYVFTRSGGSWKRQAKLKASDGAYGDWFGRSVAIDGDNIAVGANTEGSGGKTENGAVYFFKK